MNAARSKKHGALVRRPSAIWRYLKNPDAPKLPKLFLLIALAYVVMPIDLIPDLTPILGWLDDLGVAGLAIGWIGKKAAEQEAQEREVLTPEANG